MQKHPVVGEYEKDGRYTVLPLEQKEKLVAGLFDREFGQNEKFTRLNPENQQAFRKSFFDTNLPKPAPVEQPDQDPGSINYLKDPAIALARGATSLVGSTAAFVGATPLGQVAGKLVGVDTPYKSIMGATQKIGDSLAQHHSPAWQAAQQKEFIEEVPEGEGWFGSKWKPGEGVTSPTKIADLALSSIPAMATGMGAGVGIAKGLMSVAAKKSIPWLTASRAGMIGGAIGEGGVAGVMGAGEAFNTMQGLDDETIATSPYFRGKYGDNVTPENIEAARDQMASTAAMLVGFAVAPTVGVLGAPSGSLIGRAIGGEAGSSRLATALKSAGLELLQEGLQEPSEQLYQNIATKILADENQDLLEGLGEAAVGGGMLGGAMGGPLGAITHQSPGFTKGGAVLTNKQNSQYLLDNLSAAQDLSPQQQELLNVLSGMEKPQSTARLDAEMVKVENYMAEAEKRTDTENISRAHELIRKAQEESLTGDEALELSALQAAPMKEAETKPEGPTSVPLVNEQVSAKTAPLWADAEAEIVGSDIGPETGSVADQMQELDRRIGILQQQGQDTTALEQERAGLEVQPEVETQAQPEQQFQADPDADPDFQQAKAAFDAIDNAPADQRPAILENYKRAKAVHDAAKAEQDAIKKAKAKAKDGTPESAQALLDLLAQRDAKQQGQQSQAEQQAQAKAQAEAAPVIAVAEKIVKGGELTAQEQQTYREKHAEVWAEVQKQQFGRDAKERVQKVLGRHFKGISNLVEVHQDVSTMPARAVKKQGNKAHLIHGFYDSATGKVHVNAAQLGANPELVRNKIIHETFTHLGLREGLGEAEAGQIFEGIYKRLNKKDRARIADMNNLKETEHAKIGEEWLAYESERVLRAGKSNSVWRQMADAIRKMLKSWGFNIKPTDLEIAGWVKQGRVGAIERAETWGREQAEIAAQREADAIRTQQAVDQFNAGVQEIAGRLALPAGQGLELVPDGQRRDLPVPSSAIPMGPARPNQQMVNEIGRMQGEFANIQKMFDEATSQAQVQAALRKQTEFLERVRQHPALGQGVDFEMYSPWRSDAAMQSAGVKSRTAQQSPYLAVGEEAQGEMTQALEAGVEAQAMDADFEGFAQRDRADIHQLSDAIATPEAKTKREAELQAEREAAEKYLKGVGLDPSQAKSDPVTAHVWGRIDGKSMAKVLQDKGAYQELVRRFGRGFFKKSGIHIDEVVSEVQQFAPQIETASDLYSHLENWGDQVQGAKGDARFSMAEEGDSLFIRKSTKAERGATAKSRAFAAIPEKEGYEKVYKPYGEEGEGFYYVKKAEQPWQMGYTELRDKLSNIYTKEDLSSVRGLLAELFPEQLQSDHDAWGIRRAVERGDEIPRVPMTELSQKHKKLIRQALADGKTIPPEVLAEYPDLAKSDHPPIVARALEDPVVVMHNLADKDLKALNKAVKDGVLEKGKGGPFPVLKTVFAKPGYDFDGERQKAMAKLKGETPQAKPAEPKKTIPRGKKGQERQFSMFSMAQQDKRYMDAVEKGDMETAADILAEVRRAKGYISSDEFKMQHRAPDRGDESLATIKESGVIPKDYWTHPQYYQSTSDEMASWSKISRAVDRQKQSDKPVRIPVYRAVPKDVKESNLRNGDWVSPSLEYAKNEGGMISGGYRIIQGYARLDQLWWDGNSINEFGYDDGKDYAYKNTKNNRKLTNVVTRDDDGNIIPPSKRYSERKDDVRYSMADPAFEKKVQSFSEKVEKELGLESFDVFVNNTGDLKLSLMIVPKGKRRQGVGSQAMERLLAFADEHGRRIVVTPAVADDAIGTTSRARLVKFYKQHGFVENKGRNKNFRISEGMFRRPQTADDVRYSMYSEMERVLTKPGMLPKSSSKNGMTNAIKKHVGKFKGVELEESGLLDYIQGMKQDMVTLKDVEDYLAMNQIRIEEVVKGAGTQEDSWFAAYVDGDSIGSPFTTEAEARAELEDSFPGRTDMEVRRGERDRATRETPTRYDQYQAPGGENYREVLLKLPRGRQWTASEEAEFKKLDRPVSGLTEQEQKRANELLDIKVGKAGQEYRSSHWPDDANVLLHLRMNERTDADGKRVLFLEELQSDWHQEGRKDGYRGDDRLPDGFEAKQKTENRWIVIGPSERVVGSGTTRADAIADAESRGEAGGFGIQGKIPDAPFKPTDRWAMLGIKRSIQEAVANGFDRVAWLPGEAQAERYDLSKQVDVVYYHPESHQLRAEGEGRNLISKTVQPEQLADYVGKEVAEKLLKTTLQDVPKYGGNKMHVLEGADLKVGGEGMKGFYDRILPKEVGKYIKKWGAKVNVTEINEGDRLAGKETGRWEVVSYETGTEEHLKTFDDRQEARDFAQTLDFNGWVVKPEREKPGGDPVWSFDITPQMKQSVTTEGQPLYSMAGKKAQGADLLKLQTAKQMQRKGVSRDEVWEQTGWWEIVPGSGKWAFEIDDSKVRLKAKVKRDGPLVLGHATDLGSILHAPKLFRAYPGLADIGTVYTIDPELDSPGGSFTPSVDRSAEGLFDISAQIEARGRTAEEVKATLLHEIQHYIQHQEGFAAGGSMRNAQRYANEANAYQQVFEQQIGQAREDLGNSTKKAASMLTAEDKAYIEEWGGGKENTQAVIDMYHGDVRRFYQDTLSTMATMNRANDPNLERNFSGNPDISRFSDPVRKELEGPIGDKAMAMREKYRKMHKADKLHKSAIGDPYNTYRRLTGEAEARLVQERMKMNPAHKSMEKPWDTLKRIMEDSGDAKDFSPEKDLFNVTQDGQPMFSMAKDKEYLAAVEKGDTAAAQRLVDEAAKAAGFTVGPVYHRSPHEFTEFDTDNYGPAHFGTRQAAESVRHESGYILNKKIKYAIEKEDGKYYVVPDNGPHEGADIGEFNTRKEAQDFADSQPKETPLYKVYLRGRIKDVEDAGTSGGWAREAEKARAEGYDVLRYRNEVEDAGSESYAVLNPNQIKSAEAITRDDQGNVIPLSQRFDMGQDDIRFSMAKEAEGMPKHPSVDDFMDSADTFGDFLKAVKVWDGEIAKWVETAPDMLKFPTKDRNNVQVVHKNVIPGEEPWRVTTFFKKDGEMVPWGHSQFKTKLDAVKEVADTREHDDNVMFSMSSPQRQAEVQELREGFTRKADPDTEPAVVGNSEYTDSETGLVREDNIRVDALSEALFSMAPDYGKMNKLDVRRAFESVTDRLIRSDSPTLQDLGKRINDYYDSVEKHVGWWNGAMLKHIKEVGLFKRKQFRKDFEDYWRNHDNGRAAEAQAVLDRAHPELGKAVATVKKLFHEAGVENQRVGMMVFDGKMGKWRPIGKIAEGKFWPRALRQDVQKVLKKRDYRHGKGAELWNEMVDALVTGGYITNRSEADAYIDNYFNTEASSDYFASIEKARGEKLPEMFYDYSFDVLNRYAYKWSQRISQVEQFGQELDPKHRPELFGKLIAPDSKLDFDTKDYIHQVRDVVYNVRRPGISDALMDNLNILATGMQLGNPATATLNVIGGTLLTVQMMGWKNVAKAYVELGANWKRVQQEGVELGILGKDVLNILRDTDGQVHELYDLQSNIKQGLSKFANFTMTWGGYRGTENIIRATAMLAGRYQLQDALAKWNKNIDSYESRAYRKQMEKNGIDWKQLIVEGGKGAETAKYLRKMVNIPQGSYRIDQTPLFVDTRAGRFFFKYQKFNTQVSRMFYDNFFHPFMKAETRLERARAFMPMVNYFAKAILGGTVVLAARAGLFGMNDPGPDDEDLMKAFEDDDKHRFWGLVMSRAWHSGMAAAMFGFFGNYIQFTKDVADQQRVKNPLSPPGLATIDLPIELIRRSMEQGRLTAKDFSDVTEQGFALYRGYKRIALKGLDELGSEWKQAQLEMARRERIYARKAATMFADEHGIEKRRTSMGRIGRTPMTPINSALYDALILGNTEAAREIVRRETQAVPPKERQRVRQSMQSSARARAPLSIQGNINDEERREFYRWAKDALAPANYNRVRELDLQYHRTLRLAGLTQNMPYVGPPLNQ
jgi:GNAT superfamily N-acetyltransferase